MSVAAPVIFKALTAGAAATSAHTARATRKDQKDQFAATQNAVKASAQQAEQAPQSLFKRRRKGSGPGFSDDAGAASILPGNTNGSYLGQ